MLKSAYENPTLTKDLSFIILKGVNRVAFDDVDPYLHLMNSLLSIQDSLQEQRFEQILGYPQLIFNKYENYGLYEGLEQQYFSYESTLPWSDENISLLNYIYQNKKKWEVLCSVCLGKMLQMLDENDKVLKYVAGMPGPSYIYDSYFNWIKPFVLDFIEEAKKMNYPKYSQEKIEKGNEILKSYHSIEKKLEERYKKIESSKGEITSFLSDYEPLIIGKNIKEKKISEEILYKKRDDVISLIIIETQVYAVDSDPNTFTNLSFPAQSLDRNEFQSREIHPDSSFFKMVNSYFWDESRRRKLLSKKETPPLKVEENPFNDEEEQELKESKIYPDLGNNEEFTRKKSNSEQHKKKSKLTIEVPQEKINAENQKEDYKESLSYEVVENVAKEEKLKNYPLINLPLKEVNCIRRYILRNDTLENIKFELKFNNNPKNINVFFPQAISKKIHMKSTQVIVSLLKKKYEEDWPKNVNYETSLEFTDLLSNANDQNKYQNQSNLSINTRVIPYANTYPADDYNYNNALDDYPRGGIEEYSKTNVPGKKCQLCDVVNDPNNEKCSFCEAAI